MIRRFLLRQWLRLVQFVARSFRGIWEHKVDGKGRVSIPAPFRRVLEDGDQDWKPGGDQPNFVLIYGRQKGKCIEGYSMEGIEAVEAEIRALERDSKERKRREREMAAQSGDMKVDPNGRIVLSEDLREAFNISDKAVFVGMIDKFEIWEPDAYARDQASLEEDD